MAEKKERGALRESLSGRSYAVCLGENLSGLDSGSRSGGVFRRYAFQHSKNPGAKSSGRADVQPSTTVGAKNVPLSISHLSGTSSSETTPLYSQINSWSVRCAAGSFRNF